MPWLIIVAIAGLILAGACLLSAIGALGRRHYGHASVAFILMVGLLVGAAFAWVAEERRRFLTSQREQMKRLFGLGSTLGHPTQYAKLSARGSGQIEIRKFPLAGELVESLMRGEHFSRGWRPTPVTDADLQDLNAEPAIKQAGGDDARLLREIAVSLTTPGNALLETDAQNDQHWSLWIIDMEGLSLYQIERSEDR